MSFDLRYVNARFDAELTWNGTRYATHGNLFPFVAGAFATNVFLKHYKRTPPMLRLLHPAWSYVAFGALAFAMLFKRVEKEEVEAQANMINAEVPP